MGLRAVLPGPGRGEGECHAMTGLDDRRGGSGDRCGAKQHNAGGALRAPGVPPGRLAVHLEDPRA